MNTPAMCDRELFPVSEKRQPPAELTAFGHLESETKVKPEIF
jgi:hypothetical protein